jgi:membrane protein DedA with SNARE-associated domain
MPAGCGSTEPGVPGKILFPLDHISYVGIIAVLLLTGFGLPLPEEVPIVAAGIASSVGTLNPWLAFVSCVIGALAGDTVLFAIGYHFGHSLIYRHPRVAALLHAEREAKLEQMVRKHQVKVLILSRFMIGVRAPVYLAAGVLRVPFMRFFLIDLFSATTVVGLFSWPSYAYGHKLARFIKQSEIGLSVIVVAAVLTVVFVWLWRRRRPKPEASDEPAPAAEEPLAIGAEPTKEL